jgi:ubiquinone/menaquinone biosynthesis C-methylase UbiE
VEAVSRDDFYDSPFGVVYSAYMDRPLIGRTIARIAWGGDTKRYYESMSAIAEVPDGGTIVDCPCGAGPALRALPPGSSTRYVAADLSPSMLRRVGSKAEKLGLSGIEFLETSATDLPLEAASADLFLSFWGMHCFPDPQAAAIEVGRVLKPGGRLVGATFVKEPKGFRQRFLLRPNTADFGRMCTEAELRAWLGEAGLNVTEASRSGPMFFFDARAEGGPGRVRSAELGDQQPQAKV